MPNLPPRAIPPSGHSAPAEVVCSLRGTRSMIAPETARMPPLKEPSHYGPRPCSCLGFSRYDHRPCPPRHALRERGKRLTVMSARSHTRELCCRTTGHHIPLRVAGMAFHFSAVQPGRPNPGLTVSLPNAAPTGAPFAPGVRTRGARLRIHPPVRTHMSDGEKAAAQ